MGTLAVLLAFIVAALALPPPTPHRTTLHTTASLSSSTFMPFVSHTNPRLSWTFDLSTTVPANGSADPLQGLAPGQRNRESPQSAAAPKLNCDPVQYYHPDISVECFAYEISIKKGSRWRVAFRVNISPTGLVYNQESLKEWGSYLKHVIQTKGPGPENAFDKAMVQTTTRDNYGFAISVDLWHVATEKKDDDFTEYDVAEYLAKIIPEVTCAKNADSVTWYDQPDKCGVGKLGEDGWVARNDD